MLLYRLSLYTLEDLRNKMMAVIAHSNIPKVSSHYATDDKLRLIKDLVVVAHVRVGPP